MRRHQHLLSAAAAAALVVPASLYAQVSSATVGGAVRDTTGAVIPNAKVVATEISTGVQTTAESNSSGEYTLPFLKPGEYTVVVQMTGFTRYERQHITLVSGDHPTIDIPLAVGDSGTTVEVTAATPLLQNEDASIGQVFTEKQVQDLPLNGRTPLSFVQFTAGVVATTSPVAVHAYDNSATAGFSVGGLANKNSEILLDGSPDTASDNSPAYSPPVDATSEVKLNIFESDATYGHAAGGVANIVTKSGTNRYHGTAFEYNQISALNANNYFNQRAGVRKTVYRYNQFGGTLGGPLSVPHLYNSKDKLFGFFGYEGIRTTTPAAITTFTVPTAAERTGDFSALLAQGSQYQIYNPYSATLVNGVVTRQPYAGNMIPVNPVAAQLLSYFPLPNVVTPTGVNNYVNPTNGVDRYDNEFARVDWNLNASNKLYFTYRHNERDQHVSFYFGAANPALGDTLQRVNYGGSVGDVITFSSSTIAEVKLNYTRYVQNSFENGDGFNPTSLGFPATLSSQFARPQFPRILLSNFTSLGTTTMTPGVAPYDNYGIFADVLKIAGKHSLKVGVDARKFQKGQQVFGNSAGSYTFDNTFTKANGSVTANPIGLDLAALELGLPTVATADVNAHYVGNESYLALFAQDDWRATPELVLNMGLRYDHDFSPNVRNGNAVNGFATGTASPISAAAKTAYATAPAPQLAAANFNVNGGLTFASPSDPRFSIFTSQMFSPRVGFAYSPHQLKNTVVRGGFGIYVAPVFPFNAAVNQQGFSQTTNATITGDNYLTPIDSLSNPFPTGLVAPTGSSAGLSTFLGQAITVFSPVVKNGYSERYTLGFQQQFAGLWSAEVDYVGDTNHRLPITQQLNYVQPQFLTTASNPLLDSVKVTNPFKGLLPNSSALNGATVANSQLLAAYPEFPINGVTVQNAPAGSSNYNAVDLLIQRRASKGLTLIGNYQFSKMMEAVTYLNNFQAPEYRIGQYDRPHHLSMAVTYDLPFGRGRHYGAHLNKFVDLAVGGFTLNSIYYYQSGAPLTFGNMLRSATASGTGVQGISYNPRQVTGVTKTTSTPSFDITQFATAAPVENIRVFQSQFSTIRADAFNDWDASLLKNFNFTEHTFFEFRFEAFNLNNRPVFAAPNLTTTSATFGQINTTANNPRTIQLAGKIVF